MLSNKLYRLGAYSLILGGSAGATLFEFSGTGLATLHATSIGASQVDTKGHLLINNTAAAAGAQQYSPATIWAGKGWKTTATAASQDTRFRAYAVPVEGTTNPTATWTLESSINGGAYASPLTYNSAGQMYIPTNLGVGLSSGVLATIHAKGIGATSSTSSGLFTDSSGNVIVNIKDDGVINLRGKWVQFGTLGNNLIGASADNTNANGTGKSLLFSSEAIGSSTIYSHAFYTGTFNAINGEQGVFKNTLSNFIPTSGNAVFNAQRIDTVINQTGGANGITRALYINPTLTSAADFRAIETTRGNIVFGNLPTSPVGLPTGAIWNNLGILTIV